MSNVYLLEETVIDGRLESVEFRQELILPNIQPQIVCKYRVDRSLLDAIQCEIALFFIESNHVWHFASSLSSPYNQESVVGELGIILGVSLGLYFSLIHRLKRDDGLSALGQGIRNMVLEERFYWYAKCCDIDRRATRAQKALRVLLDGDE